MTDVTDATIYTLRDLLERPNLLQPPRPVIPRLAYAGRISMLAAREKTGKSTLAAAGVATATRGLDFLGNRIDPPISVGWLALEEHMGDVVRRFQEYGADPDRVWLTREALRPLTLSGLIDEHALDVVVIDTLASYAEGRVDDPSSSTQWTPLMSTLAEVARQSGAGILVLHHGTKATGAYRDSSAIGAGVDLIVEMRTDDADAQLRDFRCRGRWDAPGFKARLHAGRYELATGGLSLDAQVLRYVEGWPGCSLRAIRDAVSGRNPDIDAALERLRDQGAIVDAGSTSKHAFKAVPMRPACPPIGGAPGHGMDGHATVPSRNGTRGTGGHGDGHTTGHARLPTVPETAGHGSGARSDGDPDTAARDAMRDGV